MVDDGDHYDDNDAVNVAFDLTCTSYIVGPLAGPPAMPRWRVLRTLDALGVRALAGCSGPEHEVHRCLQAWA